MRRKNFDRPSFDIFDILENYGAEIPAYKRGGWQAMKCFLHDDRHSSATVHSGINRFCCNAGCTEMRGEDSVGLIQLVEGCDFLTAVATAESITGQSRGEIRSQRRPGRDLFGGSWNHG